MCRDSIDVEVSVGDHVCFDDFTAGNWRVTQLLSGNRIKIQSNDSKHKYKITNAAKCLVLPFHY